MPQPWIVIYEALNSQGAARQPCIHFSTRAAPNPYTICCPAALWNTICPSSLHGIPTGLASRKHVLCTSIANAHAQPSSCSAPCGSLWYWCRVDLEKHVLCTSIVFALTPTASSPVHYEKVHHAGGVKITNIKIDFDTLLFPLGIGCTTNTHFSASADYRKKWMVLNDSAELLQVWATTHSLAEIM